MEWRNGVYLVALLSSRVIHEAFKWTGLIIRPSLVDFKPCVSLCTASELRGYSMKS